MSQNSIMVPVLEINGTEYIELQYHELYRDRMTQGVVKVVLEVLADYPHLLQEVTLGFLKLSQGKED